MKFIIILAGGRSGSDFLQSLFDGHSQVMQFPGVFKFTKLFAKILDEKNPDKISHMFCDLYPHFFDSRLQKMERHNMLGKNKNSFYYVNKHIFKKNFIYYYNHSRKKKIDILIALHKAYTRASKQNLNKKKIIIFHLHLIQFFENFRKSFDKFNNFQILLTLRDPLVSMCSTVNHWQNYRSGKDLFAKSIYDNIEMHFNIFNQLYKFRKKIFVVQLENLHLKSSQVLKNLCKLLKINYKISLKKSTYFNKSWWGDKVSKKFLNGLNPKFKNNFDKKIFFEKDIAIIENKIKNILINYNYPMRSKSKKNIKYIMFLPFKFELIVWLNSFKNRNFKQLLQIPFFLLKRLIIFFKKTPYDKNELPYSVGASD